MHTSFTRTIAERLADRASDFYIEGKVGSLSSGVFDALGDEDYNEEQIARVVAATNQAAWSKLSSCKCPHEVRFEPADLKDVLSMKSEESETLEKTSSRRLDFTSGQRGSFRKTAHVPSDPFLERLPMDRLEKFVFPNGLEKNASDPYLIPPSDTSNWARISGQVKQARDVLQNQIEENGIRLNEKIASLIRISDRLIGDGVPKEEISFVVKRASERNGDLLDSWLEKHSFAAWDTSSKDLDDFLALGEKITGRVTIWDRPFEKKAADPRAEVQTRFEASEGIDEDHPLVKSAREIDRLDREIELMEVARDDLDEKYRQAFQLSMTDEEVPPHV